MNTEPQQTEQLGTPLTEEELRVLAEMEAAEKEANAAVVAGRLATEEAARSEDNYGGALLHKTIPFGD